MYRNARPGAVRYPAGPFCRWPSSPQRRHRAGGVCLPFSAPPVSSMHALLIIGPWSHRPVSRHPPRLLRWCHRPALAGGHPTQMAGCSAKRAGSPCRHSIPGSISDPLLQLKTLAAKTVASGIGRYNAESRARRPKRSQLDACGPCPAWSISGPTPALWCPRDGPVRPGCRYR